MYSASPPPEADFLFQDMFFKQKEVIMTKVHVSDFVQTVRSCKPAKVILSVPHDGLWGHNFSGQFVPRQAGVILADRHVTPIANDMLVKCNESGLPTDMVRFLMPRMYVDANRPAPGMSECADYKTTAFVDETVRQYFEKYFTELGHSIERGISAYGNRNILVLDLHGFTRERKYRKNTDFDIILGTNYRKTIKDGAPDKSLGAHLSSCGFGVFVPSDVNTLVGGDPFPGGFICSYLSDVYGVNVIQIEIEKRFRRDDSEVDGKHLANVIAKWLTEKP